MVSFSYSYLLKLDYVKGKLSDISTVRTGIIGPDSRTLELPLLVWSDSFFFFFCVKLGLRRSLFAVRSPPYPREGISNVLA